MPLGYKADRLADRVIIIIKIVDCPIKFLLEIFPGKEATGCDRPASRPPSRPKQ